jgi:hypothetical protein
MRAETHQKRQRRLVGTRADASPARASVPLCAWLQVAACMRRTRCGGPPLLQRFLPLSTSSTTLPATASPPPRSRFPVPESRSRSYTTTNIQIAPPYRPYLYVHACRSVRVHCDNTRDRDTSGSVAPGRAGVTWRAWRGPRRRTTVRRGRARPPAPRAGARPSLCAVDRGLVGSGRFRSDTDARFSGRDPRHLLSDHRAVARCVRRGRGRRGWAGVVQSRGRENMISLLPRLGLTGMCWSLAS